MKALGLLLITVGFLAGALIALQTEENEVDWTRFLPSAALGAVGVGLARAGVKRETHAEGAVSANVGNLSKALDRVVDNIRKIDAEKAAMNPYDAHGRIDAVFRDDLTAFADARESIGHRYGLLAYADVMNEFAAGERYLNRVWSASVDGYIDEVQEYLGRARHQFEETQRKLGALVTRGS